MTALRSTQGKFTRPGKVDEPRIPMSVLAPLIERWKKENVVIPAGHDSGSGYINNGTMQQGSGWLERLSELSGVSTRFIRCIRKGEYVNWRDKSSTTWVSFDTADKLTTAMECNQEWTSGALAGFYGPLSVKGYERHLEGNHE